jgi:PAS domain S-box-containing protein
MEQRDPSFEASFRAIADAASDGIITIDSCSTITFVNASTERIFEYGPGELLGKSLTLLMPDYLRSVHLNGIRRYMDTGEKHIHWAGTQVPGLRKDGTVVSLEVSFGEFMHNAERCFSGIIRDISERKHEQRLQAAQTAASRILAHNLSSQHVLGEALQALCQALGWMAAIVWTKDETGETLQYGSGWCAVETLRSFLDRNRTLEFGRSVGLPGQVWAANEPQWIFDLRVNLENAFRWQAGHAVPFASAVAFPVISGGRVIAVMEFFSALPESPDHELLSTFSTIGYQVGQYIERRKAEQALQQSEVELHRLVRSEQLARRQAESANHAKDQFLALLSHELRTPLTSVFGWVQLLRQHSADAEVLSNALTVIDRNVRLQMRLIDDLLNLSQIVTGKLRIQCESVDPVRIVEEALQTVKPSADAKEISLALQVNGSAVLFADPARLQQVIWNLLSNAVKFTSRQGAVRVAVTTADNDVRISVSDTGVGITREFLPHVFQQFTQADCSSTRQHGGLGLGLALVEHLVELHGGTVSVESEGPGRGSTFTVQLPVAGGRAAAASSSDASEVFTGHNLRSLHVLLVECESDARETIAYALERVGASVSQAPSSEEALKAFASSSPDVLIVDVGMPSIDGLALMEAFRRHAPVLPTAVALTSQASQADKDRAFLAGFQGCLAKPVLPAQLVSLIAQLTGKTTG